MRSPSAAYTNALSTVSYALPESGAHVCCGVSKQRGTVMVRAAADVEKRRETTSSSINHITRSRKDGGTTRAAMGKPQAGDACMTNPLQEGMLPGGRGVKG